MERIQRELEEERAEEEKRLRERKIRAMTELKRKVRKRGRRQYVMQYDFRVIRRQVHVFILLDLAIVEKSIKMFRIVATDLLCVLVIQCPHHPIHSHPVEVLHSVVPHHVGCTLRSAGTPVLNLQHLPLAP